MNVHKTEPVVVGYTTIAGLLVAALAIFGVDLSDAQVVEVGSVLGVIGPVVVAWIRKHVTPTG